MIFTFFHLFLPRDSQFLHEAGCSLCSNIYVSQRILKSNKTRSLLTKLIFVKHLKQCLVYDKLLVVIIMYAQVTESCPTLQLHGLQPARLLCPQNFPGKNTGVGCHFLLQGIFQTQGLNLHFLHWQANSLPKRYLGSPSYHHITFTH